MTSPFPRTPDDLPQAWTGDGGRFSPSYEARAEALWNAAVELGLKPELAWAGSEDGEALIASEPGRDGLVWLTHLEDPNEQEIVDRQITSGLVAWMKAEIAADAAEVDAAEVDTD